MTIQRACVRLEREGFNGMLPRQSVLDALSPSRYVVVDLEDDDGYWTNSYDTLVLKFAQSDVDSLLWAVTELHFADEINYSVEGDDVFVRFWWD